MRVETFSRRIHGAGQYRTVKMLKMTGVLRGLVHGEMMFGSGGFKSGTHPPLPSPVKLKTAL